MPCPHIYSLLTLLICRKSTWSCRRPRPTSIEGQQEWECDVLSLWKNGFASGRQHITRTRTFEINALEKHRVLRFLPSPLAYRLPRSSFNNSPNIYQEMEVSEPRNQQYCTFLELPHRFFILMQTSPRSALLERYLHLLMSPRHDNGTTAILRSSIQSFLYGHNLTCPSRRF